MKNSTYKQLKLPLLTFLASHILLHKKTMLLNVYFKKDSIRIQAPIKIIN